MGLPARTSFRGLGGLRRDVFRVTNPETQVGAGTMNLALWQVAGMNRVAPLVALTLDDTGARVSGAEAWNSEDAPGLRVTVTHPNAGEYVIAAAATYPDENGVEQAVEFHGAIVTAISAVAVFPPTYTLDSATQVTVYTYDIAGVAADCAFSVDVK